MRTIYIFLLISVFCVAKDNFVFDGKEAVLNKKITALQKSIKQLKNNQTKIQQSLQDPQVIKKCIKNANYGSNKAYENYQLIKELTKTVDTLKVILQNKKTIIKVDTGANKIDIDKKIEDFMSKIDLSTQTEQIDKLQDQIKILEKQIKSIKLNSLKQTKKSSNSEQSLMLEYFEYYVIVTVILFLLMFILIVSQISRLKTLNNKLINTNN